MTLSMTAEKALSACHTESDATRCFCLLFRARRLAKLVQNRAGSTQVDDLECNGGGGGEGGGGNATVDIHLSLDQVFRLRIV